MNEAEVRAKLRKIEALFARAGADGERVAAEAAAEPTTKTDDEGGATRERESDVIQFPSTDRDLERRIDAMISRKLEEPGKTVVDLKRLDELEEAIDGLKRAVRAMR